MGQILVGTNDYNSVRAALGLDKDAARLLTDEIIEAFQHLPMAEAELFSREPSPTGITIAALMARDPLDYQRNMLKATACALTCAFLCRRLQITIPKTNKIDLGESERYDIDWAAKRQEYINDSNWAYSLTGMATGAFPKPLDHALGHLALNDPGIRPSDFTGYTSPWTGYIYGPFYGGI